MPSQSEFRRELIRKVLAQHANAGAEVNAVLAIATWEKVAEKFTPLIGEGSVSLIYARSLDLNRSAFPWLAEPQYLNDPVAHFNALLANLRRRTPGEVVEAGCALLVTFTKILDALIGERLTSLFLNNALAGGTPNHLDPTDLIKQDIEHD
jgi:hypothetical protein